MQHAYYKSTHDDRRGAAHLHEPAMPPHSGHPTYTTDGAGFIDGVQRPSTLSNAAPTQEELAQYDTLEKLRSVFHLPINDAATALGMGVTVLKKLCRDRGIKRWPFRKLSSVDKLIESVKAVRSRPLPSPVTTPRAGSSSATLPAEQVTAAAVFASLALSALNLGPDQP